MTETIRIPLSPIDHMLSDGIIITPETARQIVALAGVATPVRTLTPDELRAVCIQTHQDGDVRLPDSSWGKPTAQGDEAAVEALMEVRYCNDAEGRPPCYAIQRNIDCAKAIIRAIRDGKVPGVVASAQAKAAVEAHGRLRSERDKALADLAAAEDKLAKHMADGPLTKVDAEYLTERLKEAASDMAKLKADLAAERERLVKAEAQVAALADALWDALPLVKSYRESCVARGGRNEARRVDDLCDRIKAALAAAGEGK